MKVFALFLCSFVATAAARDRLTDIRISGGRKSKPNKWPWLASLQYGKGDNRTHICGAALIHAKWVVTSAQCVDFSWTKLDKFRVVLGEHNLSKNDTKVQVMTIMEIIIHPDWERNVPGNPNDIALIQLTIYPRIQADAYPIEWPIDRKHDFTKRKCYMSGWGKVSGSHGDILDVLHQIRMPVIPKSECLARWVPYRGVIRDSHICAYDKERAACNVDSGGPLMCREGKNWYLAGIASWGNDDCFGDYPSVYTRVSEFIKWIDGMIRTCIPGVNFEIPKDVGTCPTPPPTSPPTTTPPITPTTTATPPTPPPTSATTPPTPPPTSAAATITPPPSGAFSPEELESIWEKVASLYPDGFNASVPPEE